MAIIKIHFEDKGQDLLWFEVNTKTELIESAGPFHNSLYAGAWLPDLNFKVGGFVEYSGKFGPGTIKYPITKIESDEDC